MRDIVNLVSKIKEKYHVTNKDIASSLELPNEAFINMLDGLVPCNDYYFNKLNELYPDATKVKINFKEKETSNIEKSIEVEETKNDNYSFLAAIDEPVKVRTLIWYYFIAAIIFVSFIFLMIVASYTIKALFYVFLVIYAVLVTVLIVYGRNKNEKRMQSKEIYYNNNSFKFIEKGKETIIRYDEITDLRYSISYLFRDIVIETIFNKVHLIRIDQGKNAKTIYKSMKEKIERNRKQI